MTEFLRVLKLKLLFPSNRNSEILISSQKEFIMGYLLTLAFDIGAKYCKSQTPAIYTRVASYLDWIDEFITEANG